MVKQTTKENNIPGILPVERFCVKNRVGRGGIGEVYEAFDTHKQERVALKTLSNLSRVSIERFEREFFSLKGMEHPNLVCLKDFFKDENQCFYSMELVEGQNFLSYIRGQNVHEFDEARLRHCLEQLIEGVSFLHRCGKVHRDLKPSNIIVTPDSHLVILDFGLVTDVFCGHQFQDIGAFGTPAYMSPEQSIGNPISAATDWYSVGVLLYESMTGRLPFDGPSTQLSMKRFSQEPIPPTEFTHDLPSDLASLSMDLLRINPDERPGRREIFERLGLVYAWDKEDNSVAQDAEIYVEKIPYVGRADELRLLQETVEKHRKGETNHLLVLGEPGLGKTALVKEFLAQTRKSVDDLVVFSGKFSPNSEGRYQAFEEVVSDLTEFLIDFLGKAQGVVPQNISNVILTPSEAAAVIKVFPSLMRVRVIADIALRESRQPSSQQFRANCFRGMRKLFTLVVNHFTLLIFLDDLQWMRIDSLDLMREILYLEKEDQPLFIMTMRSQSSLQSTVEKWIRNADRIHLNPLPENDMHELATIICRKFGGRDWQPKRLSFLVKEAEGHPLFLAELIRHVATSGEDIGLSRLEDTILSRTRLLDATSRKILELVSLSGVNIDLETLADVSDMAVKDCARIITTLISRNLVRVFKISGNKMIVPYHDRVREVVAANIDEVTRKSHHLRLSYVLGQETGEVDRAIVVRHLVAAGRTEEASVEALRAAREAANALAFGQAVELYHTALGLLECNERERTEILMEYGDSLSAIGRGKEASKAYLEARRDADFTTRFYLWRCAAEQLIFSGHFKEGLTELRLMLAEIGEGFPLKPIHSLFSLLWQKILLKLRGLRWKDRDESQIEPKKLVRIDVFQTVVDTISTVDYIIGAEYQARRMLSALKTGEPRRICLAFAIEAMHTALQGTSRSFVYAKTVLKKADDIVKRHAFLDLGQLLFGVTGIVTYLQGYLREANRLLLEFEAVSMNTSIDTYVPLDTARLVRIFVMRFSGDFVSLRESYQHYLRDAERRGDKFMEANIRYMYSQLWLAEDNPQKTMQQISEITWSPPEDRGYLVHQWYNTIVKAELALYTSTTTHRIDELDQEFKAIEKSLLLRMGTVRGEYLWLKCRVYLAVASARNKEGSNCLLKAAQRMVGKLSQEKTGFRQTDIWALLVRAAIAYQRGRVEDAALFLRDAIAHAGEKETPHLKAVAERRLGQLLGGEEGERLVAKGDTWLAQNGILNPKSMTEVFAPGFIRD